MKNANQLKNYVRDHTVMMILIAFINTAYLFYLFFNIFTFSGSFYPLDLDLFGFKVVTFCFGTYLLGIGFIFVRYGIIASARKVNIFFSILSLNVFSTKSSGLIKYLSENTKIYFSGIWVRFCGIMLLVSGVFLVILSLIRVPVDGVWGRFVDTKYNISFNYPAWYKPEYKKQPWGLSIYFFDGDVEKFRLHLSKQTEEDNYKDNEYLLGMEVFGNQTFSKLLFPAGAGTDGGGYATLEPILYYSTFKNGNKYSFQFNGQEKLTETHFQIMKSVEIN